jgi:signal transduction histidine kinase
VIEVEDDGVGGARENGTGSGLRGLVDRVEAHGGTLRIESEPGEGTKVVGELPCAS